MSPTETHSTVAHQGEYQDRQHVFGPLGEAAEFVQNTHGFPGLIPFMERALVASKALLLKWEEAGEAYEDPYGAPVLNKALKLSQANQRPPGEQILLKAVLIQRSVWSCARKAWPTFREHHQALLDGAAEFSQILIRAQLLKSDARDAAHPEWKTFLSHYKALTTRTFNLRFLVEQHIALEKQATKWANELEECWMNDLKAVSSADLLQLVRRLRVWRNETTDLIRSARADCEKTWSINRLPTPDADCIMWYLFGNPGTASLDDQVYSK